MRMVLFSKEYLITLYLKLPSIVHFIVHYKGWYTN